MSKSIAPRQWSSRFAFLMAATGSAVGLGNIWRFPYLAGENGGGAFIVIYIVTSLLIALPVLIAEIMLGRIGRASPISTMRKLVAENNAGRFWMIIAWGGTIGGLVVLSYYSVIGGWTLKYVELALTGAFAGGVDTAASFTEFVGTPVSVGFWHTLFMIFTVGIVAAGVTAGIERSVIVLMPLLFLAVIGLALYGVFTPGFAQAMEFMFAFKLEDVKPETVLAAIGHGFFSASVALGAMMVYGAYLDEDELVGSSTIYVVVINTLVGIFTGIGIFSLVFTYGLEPSSGPGLTFITLPIAFGQMTGGALFGAGFFVLLVLAAVTSSISMLEPAVSWLEEVTSLSRKVLTVLTGVVVWAAGFGTVFSFSLWSDFHPLAPLGLMEGKTIFDVLDFTASNIVMPTVGLLMSFFAGWVLSSAKVGKALHAEGRLWFRFWRFSLRFIAPLGIISIFVANVLI